MSNIEQGMSKEEVGGRLHAKLLPSTFLVGHSSFNFLCVSVVNFSNGFQFEVLPASRRLPCSRRLSNNPSKCSMVVSGLMIVVRR